MNKTEYLKDLCEELIKSEKSENYRNACIRYASKLLDSALPVIFDLKHLSLLLGIKHADLVALLNLDKNILYRTKAIPKKNGGYRNILMPCLLLKYIQLHYLDYQQQTIFEIFRFLLQKQQIQLPQFEGP